MKKTNKKTTSKKVPIVIFIIITLFLFFTIVGIFLKYTRLPCHGRPCPEEYKKQIDRRINEDLNQNNVKMSISREISISKGETTQLKIGLKNNKNASLSYKIRFIPIFDQNNRPFTINNPPWFHLDQNQVGTLVVNQKDIIELDLTIPKNIKEGAYVLTLEILDNDLQPPNNIYAQKDLFITVR